MTSIRKIEANRLNAQKSTGPRTFEGKRQSRRNALRHGLTAETVIKKLEDVTDYEILEAQLLAEHRPGTVTEREMVLRLACVLWRLRRAAKIEAGLFQMEAAFIEDQTAGARRQPPPQWYDKSESNNSAPSILAVPFSPDGFEADHDSAPSAAPEAFASCFLRVSRLGYNTFDVLTRYETALWRQASQIIYMLQLARRRD
jgi:hypothetical protein